MANIWLIRTAGCASADCTKQKEMNGCSQSGIFRRTMNSGTLKPVRTPIHCSNRLFILLMTCRWKQSGIRANVLVYKNNKNHRSTSKLQEFLVKFFYGQPHHVEKRTFDLVNADITYPFLDTISPGFIKWLKIINVIFNLFQT